MDRGGKSALLRDVRRLFESGTAVGVSDALLLQRFTEHRDEAAFEALVIRHAPMILGVCRQMLRDSQEVEDAFQATLLILIRKAHTIRIDDSLAPWFYKVVYRVATRSRANATRRARIVPLELDPSVSSVDETDRRELLAIVHEELNRLPERFRTPVVLCHLEGLSHEQAAIQLQCPVGTIRSRLSRARDRLKRHLERRGLDGSACMAIAQPLAKPLTLVVRPSLIKAALSAATRSHASSFVSVSVVELSEGVLGAMMMTKLKTAAVAVFSSCVLATGVGAYAYQTHASKRVASELPAIERSQNQPAKPNLAKKPATLTEAQSRLLKRVTIKPARIPLREAITNIRDSFGFKVVFDPKLMTEIKLSDETLVFWGGEDMPLGDVVQQIFSPQLNMELIDLDLLLFYSGKNRRFVTTYSVDHLIRAASDNTKPDEKVDILPLMKLLASTVAPGTWRVKNESGDHVPFPGVEEEGNIVNSMGVSHEGSNVLWVTANPEIHELIEKQLRLFRRLNLVVQANRPASDKPTVPASEIHPSTKGKRKVERIRKLFKDLEHELDELDRDERL